MTDAAEIKYGFDPKDASSFPAEPEPAAILPSEQHPIQGSEIGACYRTLIEAGTLHDFFQHQFIIVDADFNGVEDQFEPG